MITALALLPDISHRTAYVYIDGQLQGHALPFANAVDSIDYALIKTGDSATGELFLAPVNIYKGYAVNETFVTSCPGKLPVDSTAKTTPDSSDGGNTRVRTGSRYFSSLKTCGRG